jgi:protein-L-isoaspartate(D-aspartate) O-methyltransferase
MFNLIKSNINKQAMTMAWYCSGSTNTELIENLFKAGLIQNERVKDAMIGVSII